MRTSARWPRRSSLRRSRSSIYFDGSVRGLSIGAPVEFRGITVGTVTNISLEFDRNSQQDPDPGHHRDRAAADHPGHHPGGAGADRTTAAWPRSSSSGLRAQLQTGNLLTGELFVDLTFAPGAAPAELDLSGPVPIMPSVPATLEALQASATAILNKIAALPHRGADGEPDQDRGRAGADRELAGPAAARPRPSDRRSSSCGRSSPRSTPAPAPLARQRQRRRAGGDRPPCATPRPRSPRSSGPSARARR